MYITRRYELDLPKKLRTISSGFFNVFFFLNIHIRSGMRWSFRRFFYVNVENVRRLLVEVENTSVRQAYIT